MIETALLTKLLTWASVATGVYEKVNDYRPKSWTNFKARFVVEDRLGFFYDDKLWSQI
jgi:hypothetical protein